MSDDPAEANEYCEGITIKYMVHDNKFYIFENVKNLKKAAYIYDRVWILEQVQNRPYHMRITHLAQINVDYMKARNGTEHLVKSLAAMKNYI